ncbi:MAG: HEAT repeat domain-containing protein [Anaerolineae bacterium]|jgi:HEAT repeat protein|nr:HEAT repeat domain-containing protein [Anaerolineae bacterium]
MQDAADDLVQRLKHGDSEERRVALALIGTHRYLRLIDHVVAVLATDYDPDVRAMAAWTLDWLSSADSLPALLEALYDTSFGVRAGAGQGLVHLAQRLTPALVVPEVVDVLEDDDYPEARRMAYLVLQRIDDPAARQAVKNYRE